MDRCPTCPWKYDPICGEGPEPSPILLLGERPGKNENLKGRVFVGAAGQELDETYLMKQAGLRRSEVHVQNVVRCWADNNRTPTPAEIQGCANHFLPGVLARVKPEVVVLLGASACKVCDTSIRLDAHHGRPLWRSLLGGAWEGWVWPSYHPAAGLHDGKQMNGLLEDFENLGKWWRGEWTPPQADDEKVDYKISKTPRELMDYLFIHKDNPVLACDTENHGKDKWSIQVSRAPGTGRMVLATDRGVVQFLQDWSRVKPELKCWTMHFAAHDLDELARYDIHPARWTDTLQEAYHLGNLPQGLKPLVYRLFGYEMRGWEDVVWPHSVNRLLDWLADALPIADTSMREETKKEFKRPQCSKCWHQHTRGPCNKCGCTAPPAEYATFFRSDYKPGAMSSILRHVITHTVQTADEEEPYNPWKKLPDMLENGLRGKKPEPGQWENLQAELGPVPVLGIGNVPEKEAVHYAVGDADWTGRVAARLAEIRRYESQRGGNLWVAEQDWDR